MSAFDHADEKDDFGLFGVLFVFGAIALILACCVMGTHVVFHDIGSFIHSHIHGSSSGGSGQAIASLHAHLG